MNRKRRMSEKQMPFFAHIRASILGTEQEAWKNGYIK
jgi:hypothetical protein